jgi:hypothetical protein
MKMEENTGQSFPFERTVTVVTGDELAVMKEAA